MSKLQLLLLLLQCFLFIFITELFSMVHGDVGTAAYYDPPYLPTACYDNDISPFPANNMFAAASEGIWDNRASCGRQYLVRCLSASAEEGACKDGQILVTIVDRVASMVSKSSSTGTTIVLSSSAFALIANQTLNVINIEFRQF